MLQSVYISLEYHKILLHRPTSTGMGSREMVKSVASLLFDVLIMK
jgi:hypothetical protein